MTWIPVPEGSDFPLENIPFGIADLGGTFELVTRLGDTAVFLLPLARKGLLRWDEERLFGPEPTLLRITREELRDLREQLQAILESADDWDGVLRATATLPAADVQMAAPKPTAFVDFYAGIHHASNVGKMFRPNADPLLPNYRWVPIGYNGRASSVVASGAPVTRPKGQTKGADDLAPTFGPTKALDFELEMGFYLGEGTAIGETVPVDEAERLMLGLVLVNDWSARDVQTWEYQPLGPFLAKSFQTSISPWLVTLDALEPFRIQGQTQEPAPLDYLKPAEPGHFDLKLEVLLKTEKASAPQLICQTRFAELYWSPAQLLAHQSSNGTPLEAGDLYATGTISGPEPGSFGSMLELTRRGTEPIKIEETGETRGFLSDGDTVIFRAYAERPGRRIGFGELSTLILPSS